MINTIIYYNKISVKTLIQWTIQAYSPHITSLPYSDPVFIS